MHSLDNLSCVQIIPFAPDGGRHIFSNGQPLRRKGREAACGGSISGPCQPCGALRTGDRQAGANARNYRCISCHNKLLLRESCRAGSRERPRTLQQGPHRQNPCGKGQGASGAGATGRVCLRWLRRQANDGQSLGRRERRQLLLKGPYEDHHGTAADAIAG